MQKYSIQEWADYLGITYEEAYEPNIDYITEEGVMFKDSTFRPE